MSRVAEMRSGCGLCRGAGTARGRAAGEREDTCQVCWCRAGEFKLLSGERPAVAHWVMLTESFRSGTAPLQRSWGRDRRCQGSALNGEGPCVGALLTAVCVQLQASKGAICLAGLVSMKPCAPWTAGIIILPFVSADESTVSVSSRLASAALVNMPPGAVDVLGLETPSPPTPLPIPENMRPNSLLMPGSAAGPCGRVGRSGKGGSSASARNRAHRQNSAAAVSRRPRNPATAAPAPSRARYGGCRPDRSNGSAKAAGRP